MTLKDLLLTQLEEVSFEVLPERLSFLPQKEPGCFRLYQLEVPSSLEGWEVSCYEQGAVLIPKPWVWQKLFSSEWSEAVFKHSVSSLEPSLLRSFTSSSPFVLELLERGDLQRSWDLHETRWWLELLSWWEVCAKAGRRPSDGVIKRQNWLLSKLFSQMAWSFEDPQQQSLWFSWWKLWEEWYSKLEKMGIGYK